MERAAPDLLEASIREKLWHRQRESLQQFLPPDFVGDVLMCPTCGRFLKQSEFSLDHLIPQQAIKKDPAAVRQRLSKNVRAGNILLCSKALKIGGKTVYENGCNSWKGRFYDSRLADLFCKEVGDYPGTEAHLRAALCLGYLAMVAEFGYAVALMPSGVVLRNQFFKPSKFVKDLPLTSQMMLTGSPPEDEASLLWGTPFSFHIAQDHCIATARQFSITLPLSRDPREIRNSKLKHLPSRYTLRPIFSTVFSD
jgi:hypothetical protein